MTTPQPPSLDTMPGADGAAAVAPSTPMVWMGGTPTPGYTIRRGGYHVPAEYAPIPADQAVLQMEGWDQSQLIAFKDLAERNGFTVSSYADLQQLWQQAVQAAQNSWVAYGQKVIDKPLTPQEALQRAGQMNSSLFGSGGKSGSTSTQTNIQSASDTRAMAESAYQSELGRNPTASETAGLQTSTTATTSTDGKGNTTSTGGANLGQLAVENARSQPDYAEYQASTKYFNALLSAIGRVA